MNINHVTAWQSNCDMSKAKLTFAPRPYFLNKTHLESLVLH